MKKALYAIALLTVFMAAMLVFAAVSDSVFLQKMLKPVVVQSCKNELKQSKLWQSAAFFISTEHKAELEKEICSCVGDHALNHVSAQDLARAYINESAKKSLIQQAVLSSVKGCVERALQ